MFLLKFKNTFYVFSVISSERFFTFMGQSMSSVAGRPLMEFGLQSSFHL